MEYPLMLFIGQSAVYGKEQIPSFTNLYPLVLHKFRWGKYSCFSVTEYSSAFWAGFFKHLFSPNTSSLPTAAQDITTPG